MKCLQNFSGTTRGDEITQNIKSIHAIDTPQNSA